MKKVFKKLRALANKGICKDSDFDISLVKTLNSNFLVKNIKFYFNVWLTNDEIA
jgi:hypothetical protein